MYIYMEFQWKYYCLEGFYLFINWTFICDVSWIADTKKEFLQSMWKSENLASAFVAWF